MQLPAFVLRLWHGPARTGPALRPGAVGGIRIERDQMRHGVVVMRGRQEVRQVAFILRGQLRLVTSGDLVEPWVYDALVVRGMLVPAGERIPPRTRGAA